MCRYISFVILLIIIAPRTYSQSSSSSPYSVFGIGMLNDKSSTINRMMGQVGIAIRDPNNLNNSNPAAYTSVQGPTQIFEFGFYTESNYYKTQRASDKITNGGMTGINAWFRFSKKWAGVVGLAPFSTVNYSIASTRRIGGDTGSGVTYSGSGGITQFYFGNAFQLTRNLSIGVDGSYLFGSIEKNETITSGLGSGTVLTDNVSVKKLKAEFGAQYSFFMANGRSINLGFTYTPSVRLNTSSDRMLISGIQGDTTLAEDVDIDDYILPYAAGSGISYQTKRSTLAVDFTYKAWADAALSENVKLQNTSRWAIGYTYEGNPGGTRYIDFVQIRTGIHLQNSYLVFNNVAFSEWGVSAGLGLPVADNRGSINLSYHYSELGTLQNDLIRQRSNMIVLDITFRDLWGIKRKFD